MLIVIEKEHITAECFYSLLVKHLSCKQESRERYPVEALVMIQFVYLPSKWEQDNFLKNKNKIITSLTVEGSKVGKNEQNYNKLSF